MFLTEHAVIESVSPFSTSPSSISPLNSTSIPFSHSDWLSKYSSMFDHMRLILADPGLMMRNADTRGLLTFATCHVLLRMDLLGVLTLDLPVSSLDMLENMHPRHHVLRRSRVDCNCDFLSCLLGSSSFAGTR